MLRFVSKPPVITLLNAELRADGGAISAERCGKVRQCIKAMLENLFDDIIEEVAPEEVAPMAEYHARPEVEPMPAIYCIAGCNNIDAAAALAYLLRLEGTGAKPPSAFCRCAALRCFISETLRGSGAGFCVRNQHECARTGSLSRAAHFDGARRT